LVVWKKADADVPKGSLGTVLTLQAPSSSSTFAGEAGGGERVLVRFPPAAEVSAAAAAAGGVTGGNDEKDGRGKHESENNNNNNKEEAGCSGRTALLERGATFSLAPDQLLKVGTTKQGGSGGGSPVLDHGFCFLRARDTSHPATAAAPVVRVRSGGRSGRGRGGGGGGKEGTVGGCGGGGVVPEEGSLLRSWWRSWGGWVLFLAARLAFCFCTALAGLHALAGHTIHSGFFLGASIALLASPTMAPALESDDKYTTTAATSVTNSSSSSSSNNTSAGKQRRTQQATAGFVLSVYFIVGAVVLACFLSEQRPMNY